MDRKTALSYVVTGLATLIFNPALKTTSLLSGLKKDQYLSPKDIFEQIYPFSLPELVYSYSGLEPAIDKETMIIHHTKHHQGYINKLNAALKEVPALQKASLLTLVEQWKASPEESQLAIRNHGGGHLNHAIFWNTLTDSPKKPSTEMNSLLVRDFGGYEEFNKAFSEVAKSVFGSGWAWLVTDAKGSLSITTTTNQDNPISSGIYPILGLDVWEHAYYLNYQNRRSDYIQSWFALINWDMVFQFYQYFLNTQ